MHTDPDSGISGPLGDPFGRLVDELSANPAGGPPSGQVPAVPRTGLDPPVSDVLGELQQAGFNGSMAVNEDTTVHCYRCLADATLLELDIEAVHMARSEGDQPAVVAAARCPRCDNPATLVIDGSPLADPSERRAAEMLGIVLD